MAKQQAADKAVKAYDAFIFSAFGRPFNATQADVLAIEAAEQCAIAAADRSTNEATRAAYRALRDEFRAIA